MPLHKRPNRELAVFSLSALDLFASAMGTFILMAVVLFPYYLRNEEPVRKLQQGAATVEDLKRRIAAAETQEREAKAAAAKARAETEKAKAETEQTKRGLMRVPEGGRDRTSVEFAIGCWRTEPFQHSDRHKPGVSQYCFDREGQGTLLWSRDGDRMLCSSFASIRRDGDTIYIDDKDSRCNIGQSDKGPWTADHLVCRPDTGGVVVCSGQSEGARWSVRFVRA